MKRTLTAFPDQDDQNALIEFSKTYGDPQLTEICVVVPAFNEAHTIRSVLSAIPPHFDTEHGDKLHISVLVMVDGATDGTLDIVRNYAISEDSSRPRTFICNLPRRGHGTVLRLGYGIARKYNSKYIVILDSDGQYDVKELPLLIVPLVSNEADFVSGSRILGKQETTDIVRRLGVHVFAWLVSILTGTKVTDTSFGFRSMRAEITEHLTLCQPQYHSSEMLIGLILRGCRVKEQPMTMLKRSHGKSKKGNNLVFGFRYAGVVLGTWWRERRRLNPGL
ncbi:MAG TPA: glycosyltransferase family 2 protein [Verrucomicrobiae bacterium]|jgi:glycosyltransferase involved in cell wall biosynthesis